MSTTTTTYLQAVQEMRRNLVLASQQAGRLRDCASLEEKEFYNKVRRHVFALEGEIELLEEMIIAQRRHDMQI